MYLSSPHPPPPSGFRGNNKATAPPRVVPVATGGKYTSRQSNATRQLVKMGITSRTFKPSSTQFWPFSNITNASCFSITNILNFSAQNYLTVSTQRKINLKFNIIIYLFLSAGNARHGFLMSSHIIVSMKMHKRTICMYKLVF